MKIPFNKPYLSGKELDYIAEAISSGRTSGNQTFSKKVHAFFCDTYGFKKALFTTSCTDALEMCALLLNIKEGDEIILPSYTFVSTANAFALRGAKLVFADSLKENPNIDPDEIEKLISPKTKAIVVVHYAGIACNMDRIKKICTKHDLFLIEDAAQSIDSYYNDEPLGSIGDLATFSFHETKNLGCGEGGLLAINNEVFVERAEILWEKGTNRSAFFRGEIDKYGWVDLGSSFLGSDILAAYLFAQVENIDRIQKRRIRIWELYNSKLKEGHEKGWYELPFLPEYATNNGHLFFIVCRSIEERGALIKYLKEAEIHAVFHYLSLHKSPYYNDKHDGRDLPNSDRYTDCLLRLPFYYELTNEDVLRVAEKVLQFYSQHAEA